MLEKILQKMKQQREKNSPVSDRSLEELANTYVNFIADEAALETIDFTNAIKSLDGNIHHIAAEAVKSKLTEAEQKKAKKLKEEEDKRRIEEEEKRKKELEASEVPEWMKMYMKSNEEALKARDSQIDKLMQGISGIQQEKVKNTRVTQLEDVIKDLPDLFKSPIMLGFNNAKFDEEEAFTNYLEGIKKTVADFAQQAQEQGIAVPIPKGTQKPKKENDGQTPDLKKALDMVEKKKEEEKKVVT